MMRGQVKCLARCHLWRANQQAPPSSPMSQLMLTSSPHLISMRYYKKT